MTTIIVIRENAPSDPPSYRAIAGDVQAQGVSAGQALDAVTAQLGHEETTLVVLQAKGPDEWFTAEQQQRMAELMDRWRAARDAGTLLPLEDQAELQTLIWAELEAAGKRSATLAGRLGL